MEKRKRERDKSHTDRSYNIPFVDTTVTAPAHIHPKPAEIYKEKDRQ